jgi:hypothetical protein
MLLTRDSIGAVRGCQMLQHTVNLLLLMLHSPDVTGCNPSLVRQPPAVQRLLWAWAALSRLCAHQHAVRTAHRSTASRHGLGSSSHVLYPGNQAWVTQSKQQHRPEWSG